MRRRRVLALVATAAVCLAAATSRAAPPVQTAAGIPIYRAIRIPGIPEQGYTYVFPADINNRGVIVGELDRFPGFVPCRAFLWTGQGPVRDLGDLGVYEFARAVGINDAGVVIGSAEVVEPRSARGTALHGFVWIDGKMTDLRPLGGDLESQAIAVNELGEVLVVSYDRANPKRDRYYIWSQSGIDAIGRLNFDPSGNSGTAFSMNDSRQIVGSVIHADGQERAFLWSDGTMTDLGLAPGDDFYSAAYRITNDGTVVGESAAFDAQNGHGSRSRGVVWVGTHLTRTLDPLEADFMLAALGSNERQTLVGFSGFPSRAVVSFGGPPIDLNELVPGRAPHEWLYQGRDVNDRGEIVVDGMFGCCGYLLVPR